MSDQSNNQIVNLSSSSNGNSSSTVGAVNAAGAPLQASASSIASSKPANNNFINNSGLNPGVQQIQHHGTSAHSQQLHGHSLPQQNTSSMAPSANAAVPQAVLMKANPRAVPPVASAPSLSASSSSSVPPFRATTTPHSYDHAPSASAAAYVPAARPVTLPPASSIAAPPVAAVRPPTLPSIHHVTTAVPAAASLPLSVSGRSSSVAGVASAPQHAAPPTSYQPAPVATAASSAQRSQAPVAVTQAAPASQEASAANARPLNVKVKAPLFLTSKQ